VKEGCAPVGPNLAGAARVGSNDAAPMRLLPEFAHALEAYRRAAWTAHGAAAVRGGLHWASRHTGVPTVVLAALGAVVSWRLLRRGLHFGVEVFVVLAALLAAARLGWVTW